MVNKILGYFLIIVGVVIISSICWQSYNIFNNKAEVPQVFKQQIVVTKANQNNNLLGVDIQKEMQQAIGDQLGSMIPKDSITKIMNLICWSIFAGIMILAGSSVAGVGTKLVKN